MFNVSEDATSRVKFKTFRLDLVSGKIPNVSTRSRFGFEDMRFGSRFGFGSKSLLHIFVMNR